MDEFKKYIEEMANADYETGMVMASDDYNEFKEIIVEDNPELENQSEETYNDLWDYYWEVIDERKSLTESRQNKIRESIKTIKGIKRKEVMKEDLDDKVSIQDTSLTPVNDEADEEQHPVYADATRSLIRAKNIRTKKLETDLDNAQDKDFDINKAELYTLDESLFETFIPDKERAKARLGIQDKKKDLELTDAEKEASKERAKVKLGLKDLTPDYNPDQKMSDELRKERAQKKLGLK